MISLSEVWDRLWLLLWLGLFLVMELAAVIFKRPTLSSRAWDWFSLRARKPYWLLRRVVFGVFFVCLVVFHFFLQASHWWSVVLPGIPFALVILYAVYVEKEPR